jgi:hypothetical protein
MVSYLPEVLPEAREKANCEWDLCNKKQIITRSK